MLDGLPLADAQHLFRRRFPFQHRQLAIAEERPHALRADRVVFHDGRTGAVYRHAANRLIHEEQLVEALPSLEARMLAAITAAPAPEGRVSRPVLACQA